MNADLTQEKASELSNIGVQRIMKAENDPSAKQDQTLMNNPIHYK